MGNHQEAASDRGPDCYVSIFLVFPNYRCRKTYISPSKNRYGSMGYFPSKTLKPLDKSVFGGFASSGIFAKWSRIVSLTCPNLFAILSWGMPRLCMRNILMSRPSWVTARRSAMYESTVCLERPMAFPISAERRLVFLLYARRAVSLASSSVNCLGPMASPPP